MKLKQTEFDTPESKHLKKIFWLPVRIRANDIGSEEVHRPRIYCFKSLLNVTINKLQILIHFTEWDFKKPIPNSVKMHMFAVKYPTRHKHSFLRELWILEL